MATENLKHLWGIQGRLDGVATSVRFGSSPEVEKLQAEIRDVAAQLREALLRFDPPWIFSSWDNRWRRLTTHDGLQRPVQPRRGARENGVVVPTHKPFVGRCGAMMVVHRPLPWAGTPVAPQ
jgi:hypothetical protein